MRLIVPLSAAALAVLMLSGCESPAERLGAMDSPSYSNDHTSTAGGFGLGPEDYNTNGGAFGPDMTGR